MGNAWKKSLLHQHRRLLLGVNPAFVEAVGLNPNEATRFEYEPGWIITDEVAEANMQNIVRNLCEKNWFESQRTTTMEIASACPRRN